LRTKYFHQTIPFAYFSRMRHNARSSTQPEYVAAKYLTTKYGIHSATLGRWADAGKIQHRRLPGGKRIYLLSAVRTLLGDELSKEEEADREARTICYARVSSDKQRADLERQIADLRAAYPDTLDVLSDVGSGLNFKRKNFLSLLERADRGEFSTVVVAHRDRLCRFAFELVEWFLAKSGVRIVVHGDTAANEDELAQDLLSVVNVLIAQ